MSIEAISSALEFVRSATLPSAPSLESAAPVDLALSQAKDQAAIVGSDVISFASGVTAEQRQDLINSVLLAQLVAKVQVPDSTKIYDWYNSYFEVLKQIGWVVQVEQFSTYRAASAGFEAHEAIIALATTLLGPGTGALAIVKATLDSLKSMDANSPWMTIFNRESESGRTARFQVTLAEPGDKSGFLVTLMAFGLEARSTLTQVLFFKIRSSDDVLKHFQGKVSVDAKILAGIRDEIEKKLAKHVAAYVRTLPDLNVPRPVNPAPSREALESLSPLSQQLLAGVTDESVTDAAGFREEALPELEAAPGLESSALPADWRSTISLTGYQFIVRWETGGQAYYEKVIKGRPEWPGYSSGITIGCGWDLGYHTLAEFQSQWSSRIARADCDRLIPTIGFRTVQPNRDARVAQARSLVHSLSDIVVPWAVAIDQFDNVKYPALIRQLYQSLDNLDRIHPHCRGALLSLTFNRGPAFSTSGPRFAEMREIGAAMRSGGPEDFARIPAFIRSMKRIWGASSSLSQRREGEARLFETGLAEMQLANRVVAHTAAAPESALESVTPKETLADIEARQTDDADPAEVEAILADEGLEAAGLTVASVRWNPKDDEQPDYRHLDTSLAATTFELASEDLEALIEANDFVPLPGKMVFALRGASLGGMAKRENVNAILVTDQRPDHREFRCIIGVYDRPRGTLSAYQASTVPNAAYVFKCYSMARAGTGLANLTGNILPTGCYTYTVGPHHPGTNREIPTVLRLARSPGDASPAVVLRSISDTMYDRFDVFVTTTPADNVHPGQMARGFSSAGCLTFPGFYSNGHHTGIWSDFRTALGIGPDSNGKQYSLMLLTGLDAALASRVRSGRRTSADIRRLRHGSVGPRVAALQAALGISRQGDAQLGPITRRALVARQVAKLGWADGIHSPTMDELLGFSIYAAS